MWLGVILIYWKALFGGATTADSINLQEHNFTRKYLFYAYLPPTQICLWWWKAIPSRVGYDMLLWWSLLWVSMNTAFLHKFVFRRECTVKCNSKHWDIVLSVFCKKNNTRGQATCSCKKNPPFSFSVCAFLHSIILSILRFCPLGTLCVCTVSWITLNWS